MNGLTLKDVRAIANKRANDSKKFGWNKRYFIPFLVFIIFVAVALVFSVISLDFGDRTYTNGNGEKITVVQNGGSYAEYNGDKYVQDKSEKNVGSIVLLSLLGIGVVGGIVTWCKYDEDKKKFVDKFVQHWVDNKEFLDV